MSGSRATGPDSSHTGRTTTGSSLPPAPWGRRQLGAAGQVRQARGGRPAPSGPQRRGKASLRQGDRRQGRTLPPTSSPRPGRTPALCLAPCPRTGQGHGLPSPGVEGAAATRCQTLPGHSHIPRCRPCLLARLSTSGRAALYAPRPTLGPSSASGMGSGGQATDAPLVRGPSPAVPRGRVPAPSPPQVAFLLKPPTKMVGGPGPSARPPSFCSCFCLQTGVGSSREAGRQCSSAPGCHQERVARAHLQSWTRLSLSPPKDRTVK